ncbi:hypothetical protein E0Z10_g5413 [Xylaria hypoxylon]|uniref:Uncharacterized protein n=1 Tax=Xylaria hypoxylon TaxID=37992 RepID=A0A4Z0YVC5_9PEZI|nr:hypothetical protein E0Z10_g5413 [Xylaria hypoxylon]
MFQPSSKPSAVAYMSIANSRRWNRQIIATGSSDHDNTGGGGVSLTAVSDFDDSTKVPSHPCTSNDQDEKPTTPSSNLNGNAKVFRPNVQESSETTSSVVSSTSSNVAMSSVSQPDNIQPVQSTARDKEVKDAALILMNLYYNSQQRTRSATTSTHEQYTNHNAHGRHRFGSSTAHSSPIKHVTRGHIATAETETFMNGVEQQDIGNTREQINDNTPSEGQTSIMLPENRLTLRPIADSVEDHKSPQIAHQVTPAMNNIAHYQHAQMRPQITSAVSQSTHTLPVMDNKSPADSAAPIMHNRAIEDQHPNSLYYDAKAPAFTSAVNMNVGFNNNMQVDPATPSTNYLEQGFANDSAPAMGNTQVSYPRLSPDYQHPQNNGLASGNPIAANTMQIMPMPHGDNYQRHQVHSLPNGNAYNQQGQMQGHAHGQPGYTCNQPHPPTTYAVNYQSHQAQAPENPMRYNNGHQNHRGYHEQEKQYAPVTHNYQRPQYPAMGGGMPTMFVNGGSYQKSNTQDSSTAPAHGYAYGLTGSVSDGSMSQYYPNGQSNTSTALVRLDREPVENQPNIGPMDFEMPTKATMAGRSEMLQALTENGKPSLHDLFDPKFLPFIETYKYSYPSEENGVIVIKNIPYETTRGEIIALLGKASKILNDRHEPVHIIMDRVTSKTQDAYCELSSLDAAIEMVERFKKGADNGRIGRLGNRVVEVELSSQTNLMTTLFPSSRYGVTWMGTRPQILKGSRYPWENFRAFFTEEEMVMLSKHVDNAQRSLYGRICPERPYECMISTLRKIPWYMAEYITIKQRHAVYESCMKMIATLVEKLNRPVREENAAAAKRLSPQLLDRLVTSAMLCPGLSVVQKHNVATTAGLVDWKCREFNQPRFPDSWRHQWTLVPKADMPLDVLEWYISVIRTETNRVVQSLDIHQRMPLQGMMEGLDGYWGFFWAEANFPIGPAWDNMSLAECSRLEWQAIERIITRAIQGGSIPSSYTSGTYHINSAPTKGPARLTYRRH